MCRCVHRSEHVIQAMDVTFWLRFKWVTAAGAPTGCPEDNDCSFCCAYSMSGRETPCNSFASKLLNCKKSGGGRGVQGLPTWALLIWHQH